MTRNFKFVLIGAFALVAALLSPSLSHSLFHVPEFRTAAVDSLVDLHASIEALADLNVAPEAIPTKLGAHLPRSVVAFGYPITTDTLKNDGRVEAARWLTIAPASRYSQRA